MLSSNPNYCWHSVDNLLNYSGCCAVSDRPLWHLILPWTCLLLTMRGKQGKKGRGESQEAWKNHIQDKPQKHYNWAGTNCCLYASDWQQLLKCCDSARQARARAILFQKMNKMNKKYNCLLFISYSKPHQSIMEVFSNFYPLT